MANTFTIPMPNEKVTEIKKLVDQLLNNCDIYTESSGIDRKLKEFLESEKFKSIQSKDGDLLKNLKDDEQKLSESGHSHSDNDKLIREFFNHCVIKCIKEEKLEFMIVIAVLLPVLITKSYKSLVINLIVQLSYVKIPSKWCKAEESTFHSIRENLWGYKFPDHESSLSPLEKFVYNFQTMFKRVPLHPLHSATLCYVPLPGLCTYPKCSDAFNALFPHYLSPFAKLIITNPSELFQASKTSSKIYESPTFQAIVKFKWNAFAQFRYFIVLSVYLSYFALFTAAISVTTGSMQLMIGSMILGIIQIIFFIRYAFINVVNHVGIQFFTVPSTYVVLLALILPFITGILFLIHGDTTSQVLPYLSIALLWLGFAGTLLVFKNIGIYINVIIHICRRIFWLLFFLVVFLCACTHSGTILLSVIPKGSDGLARFGRSFKHLWSGLLGNYDSLKPWEDRPLVVISMIVFSFFTNIIIVNILIAFVNNVYEEIFQRAHAEWTTIRAQYIVIIELSFMFPCERQNCEYFPSTITYEAFTEEVNEWPNKLKVSNIPIPWE